MLIRILLQYFLIFLLSLPVLSQQAKQYAFKHFSVINGLASNTVSTVKQDKDGFIWMATGNGLQRYDGHSFITFKSRINDPNTIPSNHINVLYEDSKKNLWLVADNNRVGIFDTKKFIFKEVVLPPEKRKFYITQAFFELPTGELLLLKDDGNLLLFIEKQNHFVLAPNLLGCPPQWKGIRVTWDSYIKKYWMAF